jgi:hypothetical protein
MNDADEQKKLYAVALVKSQGDAYLAALALFGNDIPRALSISREWPNDPVVQAALAEEEDNPVHLPDKLKVAWRLWELANAKAVEAKDQIKALDQYAELMEFKPKAGTTINNNTLVDNRSVMVVTDHGTNEEWEAKLRRQQAALVNDARSIN